MKVLVIFLFISSTCIFAQDDAYLPFAEQMPQIIGGIDFLYSNLEYPGKAKKDGLEGKVYILVYVNENGGVDDAKVIKSPSTDFSEAAIKAVKAVKYSAGKNAGIAVKVKMSLCINFKLKK